jgi:hypothetical protein
MGWCGDLVFGRRDSAGLRARRGRSTVGQRRGGFARSCRATTAVGGTLPADPDNPLVELDPVTYAAARSIVDPDCLLARMPLAVPVEGVVSVVGPPAETRNVIRAMAAQLVVVHARTTSP